MSKNIPDLRKTLLKYKRSINDDNIDIIVECIINGYIKINGIKTYIPVEILKILCQYYGNIFESNIITNIQEMHSFLDLILKQLNKTGIILRKIYDANMDGFAVETFHLKCDNKGPTLCIIQNEYDYIFGGYTSISWNNPVHYQYSPDKSAFLYNYYPTYKIFNLKDPLDSHAVRHDISYGIGFGNGCDLIIYNDANIHGGSNSNSRVYRFNQIEFTKQRDFKIKNIEVYQVQ